MIDRRNEWKYDYNLVLVIEIGPLYACFKTKDEGTADTNLVSQSYTGVSESAERMNQPPWCGRSLAMDGSPGITLFGHLSCHSD